MRPTAQRRAPARRAAGFSLVEVVLTLGILMAIMSIGGSLMSGYHDWANGELVQKDLLSIQRAIEQHEIETKSRWTVSDLPANVHGVDPWGQPYRIDPDKHMIWSIGRDGKDDGGAGDDVAVHWVPWSPTTLLAPADLRAATPGGLSVTLTWSPVSYAAGVAGYNVYRRASDTVYTTAPVNVTAIAPTGQPSYTDLSLPAPGLYYYSLEVLGSDGIRARTTNQVGASVTAQ